MIINKVILKNYQCYFGETEIVFSDKLNILLGANGEGKTKLFEAIMWVLDELNKSQNNSVASAKALHELEVGDSGVTSVALHVSKKAGDRENYTIIKESKYRKSSNGEIQYSEVEFRAEHETASGERNLISDGKSQLNELFPVVYRQYSNFEGEEALDIFETTGESDYSLLNLINLFSNADKNEKYGKVFNEVFQKAKLAEEKGAKNNSKHEREFKKLQVERDDKLTKIARKVELLEECENEISKLDKRIGESERIVENKDEFNILNDRIQSRKKKIDNKSGLIRTGYVDYLFDRKWILMHYREFIDGFNKKYDLLERERRDAENSHTAKKAAAKALISVQNDFTGLAVNVPDRATMQEMLDDKICKVCGSPAKEGSDTYVFMEKKLNALINDIETTDRKSPELFKFNYLAELRNKRVIFEEKVSRDIASTTEDIALRFKINTTSNTEIEELQTEIDEFENKKAELVSGKGKTASSYEDIMRNYMQWMKQRGDKNFYKTTYESDLTTLKAALVEIEGKMEKINTGSGDGFLTLSKQVLRSLSNVFEKIKSDEFDMILQELENKANNIFETINVESFQGKIKIQRYKHGYDKHSVRVVHELHNGLPFLTPNQSLKTSVNIAIIMAVSDMAKSKDDITTYPLIFDAPISSFDKDKSSQFLNMLGSISGQKIIMLKDFVTKEKGLVKVMEEFHALSCDTSYLLSLKRPFSPVDLTTIETQVRRL